MAKKRFASVKTELWGVFYVGHAWGLFRSLLAGFAEKKEAEAWAKQYSIDHFGAVLTIEEIKVTIPAWDGIVNNKIQNSI